MIEATCRRILDAVHPAPSPEAEAALLAFAGAMADRGLLVTGYALEADGLSVTFADDARRYRVRLTEMPRILSAWEAGLPAPIDPVPEGSP